MIFGEGSFGSILWGDVGKFLNSQFLSSLFSAMAGAFGGAWAAQANAERSKLREKLEQEIKACNKAIELCASIANAHIVLKKQHVLRLKTDFEKRRETVASLEQKLGQTTGPPALLDVGQMDAGKLDHPRVRTAPLEKLMDELSISGRPRGLFAFLLQSVEALTESIRARNALIDDHRQIFFQDTDRVVRLVYGLPLPEGGVDTTYKDLVHGIYMETDDCIEFARRIGSDLETHGKRIRKTYERRFKQPIARISEVNYATAYKAGLMPTASEYDGVAAGYISPMPHTEGERLKKCWVGSKRSFRWIGWRCGLKSRKKVMASGM